LELILASAFVLQPFGSVQPMARGRNCRVDRFVCVGSVAVVDAIKRVAKAEALAAAAQISFIHCMLNINFIRILVQ
jgi:hypothetical protein